ncbi:CcmD family protein [bacterium]|nr:CcmD family protein [bacterium]
MNSNTPQTYWYLFLGYTAFWLLISAFLVVFGNKLRKMNDEIVRLKERNSK